MSAKEQEKGLYKRNDIYWFTYTRNGIKNRVSTKTRSIQKAIEFKYKLLERLYEEDNKEDKSEIVNFKNILHTLDFMVAKFLEEKTRILKKRTLDNYKICLRCILSFFKEDTLINDITRILIKEYENYRKINGCSDGELIKELKLLKNIFNYAIENELLDNNLFDRYNFKKNYKDYEPRLRFLTPEECQKIIENSNEYLRRLIIFLLETGLRIKEALNLEFTDISIEPKTNINFVRVRKEISKNKKERFVPLSKKAMEQINKQKVDFKYSFYIFTDSKGNYYKTTPKKALKTALKKANIKDTKNIGFHIFRHTFASHKLQGINYRGEKIKPVRIEVISEILGHSNIAITSDVYAKLNNNALLEILDN